MPRPPRTGPPPNAARDDVGSFAPPELTREQRLRADWARETRLGLEAKDRPRKKPVAELAEDFTERAAIIEYLGNVPRVDAERAARRIVYGITNDGRGR